MKIRKSEFMAKIEFLSYRADKIPNFWLTTVENKIGLDFYVVQVCIKDPLLKKRARSTLDQLVYLVCIESSQHLEEHHFVQPNPGSSNHDTQHI